MRKIVLSFTFAAFAGLGLAACGSSNNCDKLADEVSSCFSSLDCSGRADDAAKMACESAKTAYEGNTDAAGECTTAIDAIAEACLGKVSAADDCSCTLN